MVLPIVLKPPPCPWSLPTSAASGCRRSRPCSPSSQPGPKEKTETAPRVFSRVSRRKDRRLHLPEAICSDNWAQAPSVPAALVCVGPCHLHTCVVVRTALCLLCVGHCVGLCLKGPDCYGLSLLQSHTLIPRWCPGHNGDQVQVGVQVDWRGLKAPAGHCWKRSRRHRYRHCFSRSSFMYNGSSAMLHAAH